MKSHPLAPVFAMALLLAILMWVCSSCEKRAIKSIDVTQNDIVIQKECQRYVYIDPACEPIYARSNTTYNEGDTTTIEGCLMFIDVEPLVGKHMIIIAPIPLSLIQGDSVTDNWIELSPDFEGEAVFDMNSPKDMTFARNTIGMGERNNVALFKYRKEIQSNEK